MTENTPGTGPVNKGALGIETGAGLPPVRAANKRIMVRDRKGREAEEIAESHRVSPIAARVLAARGFVAGKALADFLAPSLKEGLPDPAALKGLPEACSIVRKAVHGKQKIAIACDFDVDGLSGGAMVHHFLLSLGMQSRVFVPDRFVDGYGLSEAIVREAHKDGSSLLIAIDYGTSNPAELLLARELGLKTIVVDHHHVGEGEVPADAFVNPNQAGCGFAGGILCAAGLAFYLLIGLRKALPEASGIDVRQYLDLACLGTICDMVPLLGVNRVIATKGLDALATTTRPGLQALKNVAGIAGRPSSTDVSFGIGPRMNAAGRMIHGDMVIDLLTTSDSMKARKIASDLGKLNTERQDTETLMKNEAVQMLTLREALPEGIVVASDQFHTGVVGIVAQRLSELYYRPAVVLGVDTDGVYKGSVRGIKGFNVVEALSSLGPLLLKYGGHEGAGGLSLKAEMLAEFTKAWEHECALRLAGQSLEPVCLADTEISLSDVKVELVRELNMFSPFGIGNPAPLFLIRNIKVASVTSIKSAHLKATFTDGLYFINGILWRAPDHPHLFRGAKVNIVCKPDTSTYRGVTELQLTLQAVEPAE